MNAILWLILGIILGELGMSQFLLKDEDKDEGSEDDE